MERALLSLNNNLKDFERPIGSWAVHEGAEALVFRNLSTIPAPVINRTPLHMLSNQF